jgi:hypothetical protein
VNPVDKRDVVEILQQVVLALDEVRSELESLGRQPKQVEQAIESLRSLEFRMLNEVEAHEFIL